MFGDMLSAVVDITRQPGNRKLRCAANADILPVGNCEGSKPCVRRLPMSKPDRSGGTPKLLNAHTARAGYTSPVPPMLSQLIRAAAMLAFSSIADHYDRPRTSSCNSGFSVNT